MPQFGRKPAAEVSVRRPDGTITTFVRRKEKAAVDPNPKGYDPNDADFRDVMECPPYTASFNNLLEERRPNENPIRFVNLVHDRMSLEGIPLNTKTYNLLIKRVVRYADGTIFSLYEELKAEGTKESCSVRPDLETFRLLFRACERGAEYNRAFILYQQMRDLFQLIPEAPTYNTLLGYCAAARDVAQASYFVEEMKESGVELDVNTYNCLMSVLVDTAPYEETLRVFNEMMDQSIKPTNRTYNTIIKAARVHDDYDRSFQFFEEMKKKGLIPDITTYNSLLWMCEQRLDYVFGRGKYAGAQRTNEQRITGRNAVAELSVTLLSEMADAEVSPNTFSYNKILTVLLQCEDYRIFQVYRQILDAYEDEEERVRLQQNSRSRRKKKANAATVVDVEEDDDGVNGLRSEEAIRNALEEAMTSEDPQSEGSIRANGVHPNIETYKLIIRACWQLNHSEKCRGLFEHSKRSGISMDRSLAILLLQICTTRKDKQWAAEIMAEARELRLLIDAHLYNQYVAVLAATHDDEMAREFEHMMLGINEFGAQANVETCNLVIRGYLSLDNVDAAKKLYDDLCSPVSVINPDDETYCCMMDIFERLGDYDYPLWALEDCQRRGITWGIQAYLRLLRFLCDRNNARILQVFESLCRCSNPYAEVMLPDVTVDCYNVMMEYYLANKMYDGVVRCFEDLRGGMAGKALEANASTYKVLFQMYSQQMECKAVIALFDDARMNSVSLDVSIYNIIIATFVPSEDPFLFDVLRDMKDACVPPADSTMAIFLPTASGRALLADLTQRKLFFSSPDFHYF